MASFYQVSSPPPPPTSPSSGLAAISELTIQLNDLKILATKTLVSDLSNVSNPRWYHRIITFIRPARLPSALDQFTVGVRTLAVGSVGEKLFLAGDGTSIEAWRVDATYETLLRPLIELSYILERGAAIPPKRLNRLLMALAIGRLVFVLVALGEGLRAYIGPQRYERTQHAVTRMERAEAAWRNSSSSQS